MAQNVDYLRRLAELDAIVAQASLAPEVLVDRAAAMLAGRVGCRFSEAHAYLLSTASQRQRTVAQVAAEVMAVLEAGSAPLEAGRLDAAVRGAAPPGDAGDLLPDPATDPAGWAGLMQQVLDSLPGQHSALLPVRDPGGAVVDFVFAAITPSIADLSGRDGGQIVGRRLSELYPSVVAGPVWQAWCDTLSDRRPRRVGPLPYLGAPDTSPADMSITVRTWPVGPGLLNSWVRQDEQDRLAERIAQTERLGNLGWGETDLVTGTITWSDELYRIYERDRALGPLSQEQQRTMIVPEDEPIQRQAAASFARGETVDITYRIRLGERIKYLRGVADAVRDLHGRPVKLYGIVQDVTVRETSRAKLAEIERQLREQERTLAAEHQVAVQLQQIVLPIPAQPFELAGLRVAVRYLPAEHASRIGGDWYHASVADDGSVLLAVGDVAGHGIRAAAVMAQLRHALATLVATTTSDPSALLAHLNRLLYAAGPSGRTATAAVARYVPATRQLSWAQAGHPAPLLNRNGRTTALHRPRGVLLGAVRDTRYATATLQLQRGDLLLFYTDGLIEQRDSTSEEGLAAVAGALDRVVARERRYPLADLLAELPPANPDDDTCVLAVGPLADGAGYPVAGGSPASLVDSFVDGFNLVAVRHDVERRAAEQGLSGTDLYYFVVAANELMTNAVRHGGGSGRLELWRSDDRLLCRVTDQGPGMPAAALGEVRLPRPDVVGGRGLWLAQTGSSDMSIETGPAGTAVTLTRLLAARQPGPGAESLVSQGESAVAGVRRDADGR